MPSSLLLSLARGMGKEKSVKRYSEFAKLE
jgi:hypothetical protein